MERTQRVRQAGTMYIAGSVLWIALITAQTAIWGFEAPAGSAAFYATQVAFVVCQLLLLAGFFGLLWSGAIGRGIAGKIAFALGALGHIVFVAAELHSLSMGSTSDLTAAGALVSAVGIMLTGIGVLVAGRWQGWTRWMPLLTGLYPFVAMFPFIIVADEPNGYAIAGWGIVRLALGLAIRAQAAAQPAATPSGGVALPRQGV